MVLYKFLNNAVKNITAVKSINTGFFAIILVVFHLAMTQSSLAESEDLNSAQSRIFKSKHTMVSKGY